MNPITYFFNRTFTEKGPDKKPLKGADGKPIKKTEQVYYLLIADAANQDQPALNYTDNAGNRVPIDPDIFEADKAPENSAPSKILEGLVTYLFTLVKPVVDKHGWDGVRWVWHKFILPRSEQLFDLASKTLDDGTVVTDNEKFALALASTSGGRGGSESAKIEEAYEGAQQFVAAYMSALLGVGCAMGQQPTDEQFLAVSSALGFTDPRQVAAKVQAVSETIRTLQPKIAEIHKKKAELAAAREKKRNEKKAAAPAPAPAPAPAA